MIKATSALQKASNFLQQNVKNKSDKMEIAVNKSFMFFLEARRWDVNNVLIEGGKIYSLDSPSHELVQWDGLVSATHKENEQKMLFLIETKENSSMSDIQGHSEALYERGIRTYEYLQQLKYPLQKGISYPESKTAQHDTFKRLVNYNLTVVYASSFMSDAIKEQANKARKDLKSNAYPIEVWTMEYLRFVSSTLSIMTDDKWTTDEWNSWAEKGGDNDEEDGNNVQEDG